MLNDLTKAFAPALAMSGIAPPGKGNSVRHDVTIITFPLPCFLSLGIAYFINLNG